MNRDFKGIWIPKEIWLNPTISMQAKALWAEIHSLYSSEKGGCYASNEHLADFMGLKLRRTQEVLKELKDADLLKQASFNGRERILIAIVPKHEYKKESEKKEEVQEAAREGCRKLHVSDAGSCVPSYIERKEENKNTSPADRELAQFLFSKIQEKNPKAAKPNFNKWANDISKLKRTRKRTDEEIKEMIEWGCSHHFWPKALKGTESLLKNYDQMFVQKQMEEEDPKNIKFKKAKEKEETFQEHKKIGEQFVNDLVAEGNTLGFKLGENGISYNIKGKHGIIGFSEKNFKQIIKKAHEKAKE